VVTFSLSGLGVVRAFFLPPILLVGSPFFPLLDGVCFPGSAEVLPCWEFCSFFLFFWSLSIFCTCYCTDFYYLYIYNFPFKKKEKQGRVEIPVSLVKFKKMF
jgi:hypothetical protein